MANPISNDEDYDEPDHIYSGDTLRSKDIDYDDDDIVDSDIVSDDQVDNTFSADGGPSTTPTLAEEDFDRIVTDTSEGR